MINSVDETIVAWFNTDFGTNFSNGVFGNFCLLIVSFLLTFLFAGMIGYEREYHGHNAGLRTHLLVALGACVIMVLSIYGFGYWDHLYLDRTSNALSRDPARLAAQVVSGIGFLGAGTIIQTGINIKGLTTATTLWISMAIGLACGAGCVVLAAVVTALSIFVLIGLNRVERYAWRKNPIIILVLPSDRPALRDILTIANRFDVALENTSSELITFQEESALRIKIQCGYANNPRLNAFVDELRFSLHPLEIKVTGEM